MDVVKQEPNAMAEKPKSEKCRAICGEVYSVVVLRLRYAPSGVLVLVLGAERLHLLLPRRNLLPPHHCFSEADPKDFA